ncbi:MAG: hypothetical protein A3I24_04480 [Candidatus Harrisonbacteria bacterium RIFCSPLOWO2_02_FULL_41_13b]|uniref:Uncharacterized protein n=1 Tax=Candidatus Harrisonbacteria bacterium RIFCSPLOWO2_02_FULL_41_13b TaxID=1798409 RepID=A0A1G1ZPY7_9BACT|nr:MAG: hypothetical protein A3J53_02710 [Candidatus Harrisonbacteria bacterium RIFCSPHIGHO2_02_FULL_40_20]OGY66748.1 MAG: hypothetical protein A3I24_04480 [Candidatus Harrisonbacteria bacterium RIFCSPLOWO2_02_FULL_41_13b]
MAWYRAEVSGIGFTMQAGEKLRDVKAVCYEFSADNDENAIEKAVQFAKTGQVIESFWFDGTYTKINIMKFITPLPTESKAYLV